MTDSAFRLHIVGGTEVDPQPEPVVTPKKPHKKRPSLKNQIMHFKCTPCSEELGYDHSRLTQELTAPMEANGKFIGGGLYWCCTRCHKPYYMIRMYGTKK